MKLRLEHAQNASKLSLETRLDSTILRSNIILSYMYSDMDKGDLYKNTNLKNLILASKLNDSVAIANINYGLGYFYWEEAKTDSAYFHFYNAEKMFNALGDLRKEGEILLNIANIQETTKDYTGGEATAIRAISLMETLPTTERNLDTLWALYNLLGIISERFEQRDQALEYYQKSLDIASKMEYPLFYEFNSRNNIAFTLREKGELNTALEMFQELLDDKRLKQISPELFVIVMENDATTKFLNNNPDLNSIENQFREAYRVADSINDPTSKINVLGDWANFYYETNRYEEALKLNTENYNLAKESDNNDVVLKALKLMSQLEGGEKGKQYLDQYIHLNDSLIKNERAFRNKFARISFEVDKIEADNEQLSRQTLILTIVTIALLFSIVFIYIIITQRARNRKLQFIQKQQEANEEIYNLMLAQQDKIEEGRTHEKKRISEELHDGILGKLFGTRLSLDSLNLVQTEEAAKNRSHYIDQLKTIETEIRKISHDLNSDFVSDSSFIDIIKALIETQTTAYNLEFEFSNDDAIDWEEMPNKTKIHIYRMLQETMQNIYKHANASLVKISFQLKNNVILCAIEDNGSGFNVNKARKGIGLKNIDSRVKEIEGKAEIFSKIDTGTTIKIFIPVK
jgi:signal transduction histidine kinase